MFFRDVAMKRISSIFFLAVVGFSPCLLPDLFAQESPTPQEYKLETNILYRDQSDGPLTPYARERCRLDLYYPEKSNGFSTVVWFHGGGLKAGERSIAEQLKGQGIAVAAANYRLYSRVKSPTYIEDAAAAVAWVFNNIERYGGRPDRVFVSGHSAGGYLTSMVGLDKRWLAAFGIDADRIAGLIPFSGHAITHMTVREERGIPSTQPIIDEYAPLFHVRADSPPLLLITGDRDLELLGRYEENAYFWRMMKLAGHTSTTLYELEGFNHGGMAVPAYPLLLQHIRDYQPPSEEE